MGADGGDTLGVNFKPDTLFLHPKKLNLTDPVDGIKLTLELLRGLFHLTVAETLSGHRDGRNRHITNIGVDEGSLCALWQVTCDLIHLIAQVLPNWLKVINIVFQDNRYLDAPRHEQGLYVFHFLD